MELLWIKARPFINTLLTLIASPGQQPDQSPPDAPPATAARDSRGSSPSCPPDVDDIDQPVRKELWGQNGERLLRSSLPAPTQRIEVQVSADVAAEEPQHRGGVLQGRAGLSLRLHRSRLEPLTPQPGQACRARDQQAEEGAVGGTRESHERLVAVGESPIEISLMWGS